MKQRSPDDLQPELWTILALANDCLADEPQSLPDIQPEPVPAARDWPAAALAYLAKLGRPPAAAVQFTAAARRYLNGSLVVGSHSWGDMIPAWLRDAIQVARLGLVMASETELASEEEAVAYLMAASLEAPLAHEWAELYFWLCARVLTRWGKVQEADFWAMLGDTRPQRELDRNQQDDLRRLLGAIRRSVEKHATQA